MGRGKTCNFLPDFLNGCRATGSGAVERRNDGTRKFGRKDDRLPLGRGADRRMPRSGCRVCRVRPGMSGDVRPVVAALRGVAQEFAG